MVFLKIAFSHIFSILQASRPASLHPNFHHQIVFAKFNLDIWHYQKAKIVLIQPAINSYDWEKAFFNIDIDKMLSIFNQIIINILCTFIPHKTVLFDDRDPSWMNKEIKKLINEKKKKSVVSVEIITTSSY